MCWIFTFQTLSTFINLPIVYPWSFPYPFISHTVYLWIFPYPYISPIVYPMFFPCTGYFLCDFWFAFWVIWILKLCFNKHSTITLFSRQFCLARVKNWDLIEGKSPMFSRMSLAVGMLSGLGGQNGLNIESQPLSPPRERRLFPETWLWSNTSIG